MAAGQPAQDLSSIVGTLGDLFGGTTSTSGTTSGAQKSTGKQTEQLVLEDAAIQKLIEDVLGGADGLASIFAGEQSAGIFGSSVAAEAAGDLTAKLVGELAKLTGKKTITQEGTVETEQTSKQEKKDEGILSSIGDFFGF